MLHSISLFFFFFLLNTFSDVVDESLYVSSVNMRGRAHACAAYLEQIKIQVHKRFTYNIVANSSVRSVCSEGGARGGGMCLVMQEAIGAQWQHL